ncbi:ABC transporter permease [Gracilimonas tropica]|uniref:ABC transporter permease n=1 Tax=Gracilimonas tropica TaxID=454600 RepID=UPI00037EBB07|nr:proline/glycine betaine ABC transporter permease [Gracilimonas tropica]
MFDIPVGDFFEFLINWLTENLGGFFDLITVTVKTFLVGIENVLLFPHPILMIILLSALAWYVSGKGVGIFTVIGLFVVEGMDMWEGTMETLALIITAVFIALLVGIPLGIWASKNSTVEKITRPVLDFMQTMPAFVYLIPAVLFFGLGEVPGIIATLIFAMPPAVRLTNLGIRQVPEEIREAALAFGSDSRQMLFKVELPVALPTILAGVNQTIMLALSMVVIAALIGAGGLGQPVVTGLQQLDIGLGFEGGLAIVILAVFLDRVTQSLGERSQ